MYAVIITNGMRSPTIWGVGETEHAAQLDAAANAADAGAGSWDLSYAHTVGISVERAARIEAGDIDASDLVTRLT